MNVDDISVIFVKITIELEARQHEPELADLRRVHRWLCAVDLRHMCRCEAWLACCLHGPADSPFSCAGSRCSADPAAMSTKTATPGAR